MKKWFFPVLLLFFTINDFGQDDLFTGMRGEVYKINLNTKKEEWLLPE